MLNKKITQETRTKWRDAEKGRYQKDMGENVQRYKRA
jgi:hypothetical protein